MKGSMATKLRGRLLKVFPICDWSLVALAQNFISDLVSTFTCCVEAGKMEELTGELGYHKAGVEAIEGWSKKSRWLYNSTKCIQCLVYQVWL